MFDAFPLKHILVIGDVMLDEYVFGDVNRISPEAPVPVLHVHKTEYRLGGAANVAHNIVSLGGKCTLVGQVGRDDSNSKLLFELGKKGIRHFLVERDDMPTIKKRRIVARNQQVIRVDTEMIKKLQAEHIEKIKNFLDMNSFDMIILSDYNKGMFSEDLMDILKPYQNKIIADPKPHNSALFRGVLAITPNLKESREISGEEDVEKIGASLMNSMNTNVFVTRSDKGVSVFEIASLQHIHIPTIAREVYDVSGAGDTFISALTLSLAVGATLQESAYYGVLASSIVVGKVGTAVATPEEILSFKV